MWRRIHAAAWFVLWCGGGWLSLFRTVRAARSEYARRDFKPLTQRMGVAMSDAARDRLRTRWLRVRP